MAQSVGMVRAHERRLTKQGYKVHGRHYSFRYEYVAAVRSDTAIHTPLYPLPPALTSAAVRSAMPKGC